MATQILNSILAPGVTVQLMCNDVIMRCTQIIARNESTRNLRVQCFSPRAFLYTLRAGESLDYTFKTQERLAWSWQPVTDDLGTHNEIGGIVYQVLCGK